MSNSEEEVYKYKRGSLDRIDLCESLIPPWLHADQWAIYGLASDQGRVERMRK